MQDINSAKKEIEKLIVEFDQGKLGHTSATPEDIIKAARQIAAASAQFTVAGGNHDVVAKAAKSSVEACKDLLDKSKAASETTDDETVKSGVQTSAKKIASTVAHLLESVKDVTLTGLGQRQVSTNAQTVADGITELLNSARQLPGGAHLKMEENVGEDLDELASNELSAAAQTIQDVAAALLAAKPPKPPKGIQFDTSDVTEAIYAATIAIANAVVILVKSTYSVQQEILARQKNNPMVYRKDPMWANGLISASKNVAGACQMLVKSANAAVQGNSGEDELVAVAKSVAAATAQLMSASRAKSDPDSAAHKALSTAAKSVATATSQLVDAAKTYAANQQEEEEEEMATSYTGSAVRQLEQQMRVLKLEKELEKARQSMLKSRKKEYQK